jgi:hypothetical protein
MITTWEDIIQRARTYVDDDHKEENGWIADDKWLTMAFVEYSLLYKKWVRSGLVRVDAVNTLFTGPGGTIIPAGTDPEGSGVLAVVGVAQNYGGGRIRVLNPNQSVWGADAFFQETGSGPAMSWSASGVGDSLRITLEPQNSTENYFVRWIPCPIRPAASTESVEMPFGCDERLVLGLARRAHVKDSSASALLERLIQDQDAEANFSAFGKLMQDGPRVRRVVGIEKARKWQSGSFPSDPRYWSWY